MLSRDSNLYMAWPPRNQERSGCRFLHRKLARILLAIVPVAAQVAKKSTKMDQDRAWGGFSVE